MLYVPGDKELTIFTVFQLNLASQSVLEGLNACLDHRAEVYVPELGMTFHIQHEKTRLFACQNPLHQGGGRKGLPRSFLNRFTQVRCDTVHPKNYANGRHFVFLLCFGTGWFYPYPSWLLYPTHNEVVVGVYWFHSVRPSRIPCPLCSAYSFGWIHFIFIHLIKQLQKVCRV